MTSGKFVIIVERFVESLQHIYQLITALETVVL